MTQRPLAGWQLILADLALILFLVTLSALADVAEKTESDEFGSRIEISHSQALFRPGSGDLTLADWLAQQQRDPRATLTIFADYRPEQRKAAWDAAREMAASVEGTDLAVRIVLRPGEVNDLYASLAFDTEPRS